MSGQRYRVGRKLGRTVYDGDTVIGMMDTSELAALVVSGLNRGADTSAPREKSDGFPETCLDSDGNVCDLDRCALTVAHYATGGPR